MDIRRNSVREVESGDFVVRIGSPDGPGPVITVATVLGRRVFGAVPAAVGEARRWLRSVVGDGFPDAPACLSEALTNSVRHSRSGACREGVSVVVLGIRSAIRIEVTDAGGHSRPRLLPLDEEATSGRGLHLLNELTGGRWGWHDDRRRRTVWFEISKTGS